MQISQVINSHKEYLKSFAKETSRQSYEHLYRNFMSDFPGREIQTITAEEAFTFLNKLTEGKQQATKRLRYQQLKAIINFAINSLDITMKQICSSQMLKTAFRAPKKIRKELPDREVIDMIIYRTDNKRDKNFFECLVRSGCRVGEILKLKVKNVLGSKLVLESPKSGKAFETAYLPDKVAQRLIDYIKEENMQPEDRVFPLSYSGARSLMNRINEKFNTKIKLHDLRRFAATHASRAGVPLEIISKAILRHSSTAITDTYLGKMSDSTAMQYVNGLYEK